MTDYDKFAQDIVAKWKDNIYYIVDAELNSSVKAHTLSCDKDAFSRYVKEAVTAKVYNRSSSKQINYAYIPDTSGLCVRVYLANKADSVIEQITQQIVADWGLL